MTRPVDVLLLVWCKDVVGRTRPVDVLLLVYAFFSLYVEGRFFSYLV